MNAGILESASALRATLAFPVLSKLLKCMIILIKQRLHVSTLPVKMAKVNFGHATRTVKHTEFDNSATLTEF